MRLCVCVCVCVHMYICIFNYLKTLGLGKKGVLKTEKFKTSVL